MDHLTSIRQQFDGLGIDGLIVTKEENRRYLTGFTGTAGVVLISKKEAIFLTDFRYERQANEQIVGYEINIHGQSYSLLNNLVDHLKLLNINSLGFESVDVSHDFFAQLSDKLAVDLVPTKKVVEKLRMIKSKEEINKIRKAADIGDITFKYIQEVIRLGITEIDVANELEYCMRKNGATTNSFKLIVASGIRSSLPHGEASEKVIEQGDMVTLDYGVLYQGYRSDMTRSVAVGEPDAKLKQIYDIVYEALQGCLEVIKPGMLTNEVDANVRDFITKKGYGEYFRHGTGHGLGLEIHEDPFISHHSTDELKPGMVITIEPGIYIPDLGGVRIEDDVLITDSGCEILTRSTKKLIQV